MIKIIPVEMENLEVVGSEILPNHNKVEILSDGSKLEYITLKDTVVGESQIYVVNIGSDFWFDIKCVELPQKIAKKHKAKGGKHFEEADLVSFLTEQAYKKLTKFDRTKSDYFESFMRRWLGKNVVDFFRETQIDKLTDLETSILAKNDDEEEGNAVIFDEPVDIWAELHSDIELEEIIEGLEPEEQIIARRLLEGFNASEIARELNTYKMKVSRHIKSIVAKAGLEKKKDRVTKRVSNLQSTTKGDTLQSVKQYNAMLERRNLENKILGGTVKLWGMENFFDAEMSKLDNIKDEEVRFTKEMTLRSKAEYIEILKKDIIELENKLEKLNK